MQYRKEIDGLRAVAVFPVIMFHAGVEIFSGGYVGIYGAQESGRQVLQGPSADKIIRFIQSTPPH